MRRIFILFFALSFCFISCGKKSADQEGDAHTHDDGTVHSDHNDTTKQDKVITPVDSVMQEDAKDTLAHGHSHDH